MIAPDDLIAEIAREARISTKSVRLHPRTFYRVARHLMAKLEYEIGPVRFDGTLPLGSLKIVCDPRSYDFERRETRPVTAAGTKRSAIHGRRADPPLRATCRFPRSPCGGAVTASLTELVRFAPRVARDLGVEIRDHEARILADRDAVRVTMRLPYDLAAVTEIDGLAVAHDSSAFVDAIYACQSKLFASVAAHMRQHNHDPHNRLTQLTELVGTLIRQIDSDVDLRPHETVRGLVDDVKALLRAPAV